MGAFARIIDVATGRERPPSSEDEGEGRPAKHLASEFRNPLWKIRANGVGLLISMPGLPHYPSEATDAKRLASLWRKVIRIAQTQPAGPALTHTGQRGSPAMPLTTGHGA